MNDMAFTRRPAFGNGTSDALEVRQAIRLMCSYCADDAKIANYHHVSTETVAQVRASIAAAKRKGPERIDRSPNTPDADVQNPFVSEKRMEEMIKRGSAMLRDAVLGALAARAA